MPAKRPVGSARWIRYRAQCARWAGGASSSAGRAQRGCTARARPRPRARADNAAEGVVTAAGKLLVGAGRRGPGHNCAAPARMTGSGPHRVHGGGPEHPLTTEQGSGNEQCTQDGNDLVEPLSEGFQGLLLRAARVGRKGPQLSVPSPGTASAGVVCQLVTMGLSTVTEPVDTLAGFGSDVPIAAMRNVNSTPPLVLVVLGLIPA